MSKEADPIVAYSVGVDIGKKQDYTALAIIEHGLGYRDWSHTKRWEDVLYDRDEVVYTVTWLERLKLGMSYPDMVRTVAGRFNSVPVEAKGLQRDDCEAFKTLSVDATGVGGPVVDLLAKAGLRPIAVTITGGDKVTNEGLDYRIPKRELVTNLQVLQQQHRLKVAAGLAEGQTLAREMQNFTYKISLDTGHDSYGAWREGSHDDLVLAVAIAAWTARNRIGNGFGRLDADLVRELAFMDGSGW